MFSPVKCILGCLAGSVFHMLPKGPKMTTDESGVAGPPITSTPSLAPAADNMRMKKLYSGTKFSHMSQNPTRRTLEALGAGTTGATTGAETTGTATGRTGTTTGTLTPSPFKASDHPLFTRGDNAVNVVIRFSVTSFKASGRNIPCRVMRSDSILRKASAALPT